MLPRGDLSTSGSTAGMLALAPPPLGKLSAAQCRLAFGLVLACEHAATGGGGSGDGAVTRSRSREACPAACLPGDVVARLVCLLRTVAPLTDETIRTAVAEFGAESANFDSPRAAAKWGRVADWDVSKVVSMRQLFYSWSQFDQDIGGWQVGAVTNMSHMFSGAAAFDQDIGGWQVGAVTDMRDMFNGARAFDQDIGGWQVGAVTSMSCMFNNAAAFDQDIGDWQVGAVTDMRRMFRGATAMDASANAPWYTGDFSEEEDDY